MLKPPKVLLVGAHGTRGAAKAGDLALSVAEPGLTEVVQALVVPEFWEGMQGDDWLNNASTRDTFARHLESQLQAESRAVLAAFENRCVALGLCHRAILEIGDPAERLIGMAVIVAADLVVIGPPRDRREPGYRSRMNLETLVRGLPCPLLIAR